jgi:hypothetical protein
LPMRVPQNTIHIHHRGTVPTARSAPIPQEADILSFSRAPCGDRRRNRPYRATLSGKHCFTQQPPVLRSTAVLAPVRTQQLTGTRRATRFPTGSLHVWPRARTTFATDPHSGGRSYPVILRPTVLRGPLISASYRGRSSPANAGQPCSAAACNRLSLRSQDCRVNRQKPAV